MESPTTHILSGTKQTPSYTEQTDTLVQQYMVDGFFPVDNADYKEDFVAFIKTQLRDTNKCGDAWAWWGNDCPEQTRVAALEYFVTKYEMQKTKTVNGYTLDMLSQYCR